MARIELDALEKNNAALASKETNPLSMSVQSPSVRVARLKRVFDKSINNSRHACVEDLGGIVEVRHIMTDLPAFRTFQSCKIKYPEVVVRALSKLFSEYNRAFKKLVEANRESETDYRFIFGKDGLPINHFVQIDMTGLTPRFLRAAKLMSVDEVAEVLRGKIFEIENSIAMYQKNERLFANPGEIGTFGLRLRSALATIRKKHGKPIALLATSKEKYEAMLRTEFGVLDAKSISDDLVKELSGFDRFFSPDEFKEYVESNNGKCDFLLFVRSSEPLEKLKKPNTRVSCPLLENSDLRCLIKENAITFNIDDPNMDSDKRINDTKEYLEIMGMAYRVSSINDIFTKECITHMQSGKSLLEFEGKVLTESFADYLKLNDINPEDVIQGSQALRAKPLKGTYGCYGHVSGALNSRSFKQGLKKGLRERGEYIIQPEFDTPWVTNAFDNAEYTYIDRVFLSCIDGEFDLISGVRAMVSVSSEDAKKARIHGSVSTIWTEIY